VVAGRAREREAAAPHGLDRGAGGEQRRLERRLADDGVRVEPASRRPDELEQLRRVAAQHVVLGRRLAGDERKVLLQHGETLLRLRVVAGGMEPDEGRVAYEVHVLPC
jgi:hypothetical protein